MMHEIFRRLFGEGDYYTVMYVTGYFGLLVTAVVGSVRIAHRRFVQQTKADITTGFDRAARDLDKIAADKVSRRHDARSP